MPPKKGAKYAQRQTTPAMLAAARTRHKISTDRMIEAKRAAEREVRAKQAAAEIAAQQREDAHASSDPVTLYRAAKSDPIRLARQAALHAQIKAAIQKADAEARQGGEARKKGGRPRKVDGSRASR